MGTSRAASFGAPFVPGCSLIRVDDAHFVINHSFCRRTVISMALILLYQVVS